MLFELIGHKVYIIWNIDIPIINWCNIYIHISIFLVRRESPAQARRAEGVDCLSTVHSNVGSSWFEWGHEDISYCLKDWQYLENEHHDNDSDCVPPVQDKKCRFENPIEPVEDCHPAGEIGMIWRQVSTALCLNDSDVESCDGLAKEKEHRDCYEPQ